MDPRRTSKRRRIGAIALLVAATVAGASCESGDDAESGAAPAPVAADFPPTDHRSLVAFAKGVGLTDDVVVSPGGATYEVGRNRFSFGVFEADRTQIADADVAIYAAHGPNGVARGPFPARMESLATDAAFTSQTTAQDPDAATVAYVSEVPFDRPGEWRVAAVLRRGDKMEASLLPSIRVGAFPEIPDVGDRAPRVHTPTAGDVGDLSEIDTRTPHDTMHEDDLYDVYGRKPVVLVFATPALCVSRVCGPMVDVAEQVHSETDDGVAFIHMEVYNDNDPNKGYRPQLRAYGLQTEPWLFVLDAHGRVSTRIEGPFSVDELTAAVQRATGG